MIFYWCYIKIKEQQTFMEHSLWIGFYRSRSLDKMGLQGWVLLKTFNAAFHPTTVSLCVLLFQNKLPPLPALWPPCMEEWSLYYWVQMVRVVRSNLWSKHFWKTSINSFSIQKYAKVCSKQCRLLTTAMHCVV